MSEAPITPEDMVLTPKGLRYRGRLYPCAIGRGGISGDKREGDGATPRGIHRITGMLYRPDRISAPNDWAEPSRVGDLWSDDSACPAYNTRVRVPHAFSHEDLRRADPLYDLVMILDWNRAPPVAGKGSAIFIHQWRRPRFPTAGCIAFSRSDLHALAKMVKQGTRVIVP